MNLLSAVILGMLGTDLAARRWQRSAPLAGVVVGAISTFPALVLPIGVAGAALAGRHRLAGRRRSTQMAEADVMVLAELTGLGLTAGLTPFDALLTAATEVTAPLGIEVRAVLRRAQLVGLGPALAGAAGRAHRFYAVVARAVATGAPLAAAAFSFAAQQRSEQRARHLAAARRLPVRLLLPLAMLILPGFVALTLGPTLVGALERLDLALPTVPGRMPG